MNRKIKLSITKICILLLFSYAHLVSWPDISTGSFAFEQSPIKLEFGGYIKNEGFFDSRQVFGFGNDEALLFPEKERLDICGNDINAHGQYSMVPIETILRLGARGLKAGTADLSGVIEANFFGRNGIANLCGLYLAYIELAFDTLNFKAGQWWHPMFVLECYPNTISNNSGAPMEPFSRNPQVHIRKKIGNLDIIMAALSQLDFLTDGPLLTSNSQLDFLSGGATSESRLYGFSSSYLRNSMVPNLHLQLQSHIDKHVVGAGVDFKRIVPRLVTNEGFKARESLNSFAGVAYVAFNKEKVNVRSGISYAQNGTDYGLLGGYAVKSIDWVTDNRTYTNLSAVSWWFDIESNNKKIQPGLFIGMAKNVGSHSCITGDEVDEHGVITERRIFGIAPDVDTVFRISPRIRWNISERLVFGAELEYTRAHYGAIDRMGKVQNTTGVGNTRFLFALFYFI